MRHSPLFLAAFLVFLAWIAGCSKSEEAGKFKLGLIASLTGPAAPQGQAWLNGALLAAEQLEESGKGFQIVVEDDRTAVTPAISAFNKLTKIDQVAAIIGGTWDFLAEAVYPLAAQSRIPFLTPSNPPEIFSDEAKHNPFVFTNSVTIAAEKEALKRFLLVKEAKSLGLLSSAIPWGIVHARMFREIASELQLPIVLDQEFSFESYPTILSSLALKVKSANPALVFTTIDDTGVAQLARELQRLDSKAITVNTQHLLSAYEMSKDPERFKNSFAIYPKVHSQEFEQAYIAKYKVAAPFLAAHGYDALMFIVKCFKPDVGIWRDSTCEYSGITGLHRLPTLDGALVSNQAYVATIKDGTLTDIGPTGGSSFTGP